MSATTEAPTYVTAAFLAERYGVAIRTIQNWRKNGQLPFVKLPGSTSFRYPLAEVEATLAELTREAAEADRAGTPSGASR